MYICFRLTPIFLTARKALSLNLLAQTFLIAIQALAKSVTPN